MVWHRKPFKIWLQPTWPPHIWPCLMPPMLTAQAQAVLSCLGRCCYFCQECPSSLANLPNSDLILLVPAQQTFSAKLHPPFVQTLPDLQRISRTFVQSSMVALTVLFYYCVAHIRHSNVCWWSENTYLKIMLICAKRILISGNDFSYKSEV